MNDHAPRFTKYVFVVAAPMLCWGFDNVLRTCFPRIRLSGSAPSLAEALDKLAQVPVDLLVVDVDDGYGAEALSQAAQQFNLVLLTSSRSVQHPHSAAGLDVAAVLRKDDTPASIIAELERAGEQTAHPIQTAFPTGRNASPAGDLAGRRIASLTARERQLIFALVCFSTAAGKVIASRLCISEHTLRNHLSSIYAKLGVQNRLSLHAFAVEHRLDCSPDLHPQVASQTVRRPWLSDQAGACPELIATA